MESILLTRATDFMEYFFDVDHMDLKLFIVCYLEWCHNKLYMLLILHFYITYKNCLKCMRQRRFFFFSCSFRSFASEEIFFSFFFCNAAALTFRRFSQIREIFVHVKILLTVVRATKHRMEIRSDIYKKKQLIE